MPPSRQRGQAMDRPITTLFMLSSLDGKISTGATDKMDFDKDFPNIEGLKEGLRQYYEIEQTTDLWSLNSGRVQAKVGVNTSEMPKNCPVSFVVIDNTHLTEHGVKYFIKLSKQFVLVTSNKNHPAYSLKADNMLIIYQEKLDLAGMLVQLKEQCGCERITIQTGGTLNSIFLKEKLFDYIDIVVAPVLVGGKDTPSLIDGDSIITTIELSQLGVLELIDCQKLKNSYIRLKYKTNC